MSNNLIIEIIEGHHLPEARTVGEKQYFSQKAFAHLGGPFPQEIAVSIEGPAQANAIGKYELSLSSFRVGKYNKLEISPYDMTLTPVRSTSNNSTPAK